MTNKLNGITAFTGVFGVGIVRWTIQDDRGRWHLVKTRAYYVPTAQVGLLSPQRYLHKQSGGTFLITANNSIFTFPGCDKATLTFRMWDNSGLRPDLPIGYSVSPHTTEERKSDQVYLGLNVLNPNNVNLSLAQKELLTWHFKLGHFHLEWIQRLFCV